MFENDNHIEWYNKAIDFNELEEHAKELYCYDMAIKLNPYDYCSIFNKGSTLDDLGKPEYAILCYDKVLELKADHFMALNNKGKSLCSLGKYQEALICYDKALDIESNDVIIQNRKDTIDKISSKYMLQTTDMIDLMFSLIDVVYCNDFKNKNINRILEYQIFWESIIVKTSNVYAIHIFKLKKMLDRYSRAYNDTLNQSTHKYKLEQYLYDILKITFPREFSSYDELLSV